MALPLRSRLSCREKVLFGLSVVFLVSLVSMAICNAIRNVEPVWNFPPAAPRPSPNGFDLYIAAARALRPAPTPVDAITDSQGYRLSASMAAQRYSLARKRQWLRANVGAFAIVRKALHTPSMCPDERIQGKSPPNFHGLYELVRAKVIEANAAKLANHPTQAFSSSLDAYQIGSDAARGGSLTALFECLQFHHLGHEGVADFDVTLNALRASEAKTQARRLETLLAQSPRLVDAVREYRWWILLQCRENFGRSNQEWRAQCAAEKGFAERFKAQFITKKQFIAQINAFLDAEISRLQKPYSPLTISPPLPDPWGSDQARLHDQLQLSQIHDDVSTKLLLLRLVLRAYFLENGVFPVQLKTLVPRYLKTVPADDFNAGRPLFYRVATNRKSYWLWSVGPDGVNNNGTPVPPPPGSKRLVPTSVFGGWLGNQTARAGDFVAGKNR